MEPVAQAGVTCLEQGPVTLEAVVHRDWCAVPERDPPRAEQALALDGFFTDRKHKQTQANTGSTQTEHTHRHPRDHQRAREPRQARSQRPQEKGTRADRAPRTERHKDSQDSRPQPVTESTGQGTGPCPSISATNQ